MKGHEHIRTWAAGAFRLALYDTHRRDGFCGKDRQAYEFFHDDRLIFQGEGFFASPLHSLDGDETVAALLAFLSLRPGDTNPDWFAAYSAGQRAWCREHGEELSCQLERLVERVRTRRAYEERVRGPGKFEGEPAYVPYYWDAYLQGCYADDDGEVITFDVTDEDRDLFPELQGVRRVRLYETGSGFVRQA